MHGVTARLSGEEDSVVLCAYLRNRSWAEGMSEWLRLGPKEVGGEMEQGQDHEPALQHHSVLCTWYPPWLLETRIHFKSLGAQRLPIAILSHPSLVGSCQGCLETLKYVKKGGAGLFWCPQLFLSLSISFSGESAIVRVRRCKGKRGMSLTPIERDKDHQRLPRAS